MVQFSVLYTQTFMLQITYYIHLFSQSSIIKSKQMECFNHQCILRMILQLHSLLKLWKAWRNGKLLDVLHIYTEFDSSEVIIKIQMYLLIKYYQEVNSM